jgi:hypothetical protein
MNRSRTVIGLGLVVAALATCVGHAAAEESATKPTIRIGVYDSRGIAIAWARSAEFNQGLMKLRADFEQAKAQGDTAQARKLESEGQAMQVRMHLRGFSTAGAGDLLAKVADKLPAVAREARVALIVSKWELPYKDATVEVIDVTVAVAKLFMPDEQTLKTLSELAAQPPVPLDELSLDPND